jgi:hypothetical protein
MRSELVFASMVYVSNRFLLMRLASKATRKFHRPNTRIQDTTNDVFERFTRATRQQACGIPASCRRDLALRKMTAIQSVKIEAISGLRSAAVSGNERGEYGGANTFR